MTLARQYLLLQVLIVLVVLVAVGAISIAQSARTLRAQRGPAGAERGREPRRPTRWSAQRIAAARAARPVRARLGRPSRSRTLSGLDVGAAWPAPTGVVLVSSDPDARSATAVDARAQPGAGRRRLDRHAQDVGPAPSWSPRCRSTTTRRQRRRHRRDRPRGARRCGAGSATWCPTCWSTSASPACSGSAARCCSSRRVKRQTLGMEPTEIAGLVEHREALRARRQGGRRRARPGAAGHRWSTTAPASCCSCRWTASAAGSTTSTSTRRCVEVLTAEQPGPDRLVLVGDRVLAFNRRPMRSHGAVIGSVTTLRDRTELSALRARARHAAGPPATRCARRPTSSPTSCTRSPACSSSRSTTRWCASSTASG